MGQIKAYIGAMRVKHWVKNLLIFAPLFFAGDVLKLDMVLEGVKIFFAFSFLASAIYIFNDIADRDNDKVHPLKKYRAIASGIISVRKAVFVSIICFILAVALNIGFPLEVVIILCFYFVANLFYSFWLKNVVIVDIFLVAMMYLMRIYAGGKLWNIPLSHWIILCTFFLALFLVTAKRRAELVSLGNDVGTRKVIQDYDKGFLDTVLTITATSSIVSYGLYVVSVDKPYLIYSLFFVVFGMLRYLYLIHKKDYGQNPENFMSDLWVGFVVIAWILYNGFVFYYF